MGTSVARSPEAAMKAPIRQALQVATNLLDRLVHHGARDYAAALRHEAEEPHRHPDTKSMLLAIAGSVDESRRTMEQGSHIHNSGWRAGPGPEAWNDSPHDQEPGA